MFVGLAPVCLSNCGSSLNIKVDTPLASAKSGGRCRTAPLSVMANNRLDGGVYVG